jgi:predicted acyltransferase
MTTPLHNEVELSPAGPSEAEAKAENRDSSGVAASVATAAGSERENQPLAPKARIVSLDQFRGYTVAGMLLVNFIGGYTVVPAVFKHHNTYCSYADTIMPQFFFAVGFAFRLTFLRRRSTIGLGPATLAIVRRNLGLILLGLVLYHLDGEAKTWVDLQSLGFWGFLSQGFRREPFQTLVHIGLTALWIAPVIGAGTRALWAYLLTSAALHLGLSGWFYFDWAWNTPVIDGGPLGFLSWTIPTLVGALAYDAMANRPQGEVGRLLATAAALMAAGYGLSCLGGSVPPPPFVQPTADQIVDLWTMSQRTGSVSYMTFSAGFSLFVYTLFVLACDRAPLRVGIFRTFGQNPLAAYLVHSVVAGAVKPYVPKDSPAGFLVFGFLLYFGICYLFIHSLEKNRIFLRL